MSRHPFPSRETADKTKAMSKKGTSDIMLGYGDNIG